MKENTEEQTLFDAIKEYFFARKNLILLKAADTISYGIATSIVVLIISAFTLVSLLFLGVAAAFLLAEKTGSFSLGFFIVGSFYFATTLILILIRKSALQKPLINIFIKRIFK